MIKDIQQQILELKKQRDVCILAHSYQAREIVEVADFVGDSFALSVRAGEMPHRTVVMCGVRFMAETVKILSPEKRVWLANPIAGCPMAEQMDREYILKVRAEHPGRTVVAYINTTAELKTVCDVCVTSSSALKIVRALPNDRLIFIPDCNLGAYVQQQVPEKDILLLDGGCPYHAAVRAEEAAAAKQAHPDALLLVHPECSPQVAALADYVGSTSGIMEYARQSDAKEFIIGTEGSIAGHLQYECLDKRFYPLSLDLICPHMKATTLMDVFHCVAGRGGEEIILSDEVMTGARRCIDEMIRLG